MKFAHCGCRGLVAFANFHSFRAPGFELAAVFTRRHVWWFPLNDVQLGFAGTLVFDKMRRQASQQSGRVRMLGRGEHFRCGTNFGDAAGVENKDAIREAGEESGIVSDENHGEAELLLESPKELEDILLGGRVE